MGEHYLQSVRTQLYFALFQSDQLRFFVIKQRSHPVKMFVHGFSDFPWTGWIVAIKDNYLELGDYNVFSINWNRLAHAPWYNIAATNSRLGKNIILWEIRYRKLENMHV